MRGEVAASRGDQGGGADPVLGTTPILDPLQKLTIKFANVLPFIGFIHPEVAKE